MPNFGFPISALDIRYAAIYVPYTGATAAVDLGVFNFTTSGDVRTGTLMVSSTAAAPFIIYRAANDNTGANFRNEKARGTLLSPLVVQNADNTGGIISNAYDGAVMRNVAAFRAYIDGTVGSASTPGRWVWSLSPAGSSTLADVMSINNNGHLNLGNMAGGVAPSLFFAHKTQTGLAPVMVLSAGNAANAIGDGPMIYLRAANLPTQSLNRSKGLIVYESTASFGRGDLVIYQDSAANADPVTTSDTEVIRFKNDGTTQTSQGRIVKTKRITSADSPYTALVTDHHIFADTDGGAITINLPIGENGRHYRIINCGSSANDITLTPNGAELLNGVNASETLYDGESLSLVYETTEGWW